MNHRLGWIILIFLCGSLIAACGGDEGGAPPPGAEPVEGTPAAALDTRPTFPPTWTPVPTQPSATPRPTLDYDYVRPTQPTFIPPTRTPRPATATPLPTATVVQPPTAAPQQPQPPTVQTLSLTIPGMALNQAAQAEFAAGRIPLVTSAPGFNFQPPDTVIVLVGLPVVPNDPASVAQVVIRARVGLLNGKITLTQIGTNRLGETAVVQLPQVDGLLDTLEVRIDEAIQAQFAASVPGGVSYEITAIQVTETGIQLEIRATVQ